MTKSNKYQQLKKLIKNAYTPYSNFRVAAIVETDIGEFEGVNVENSVYPVTICAERNAIFSAITAGAKKITKLWLLTDTDSELGTPCGSCRQVMVEFMTADSQIVVYSKLGSEKTYTLSQLLPYAFSKKSF